MPAASARGCPRADGDKMTIHIGTSRVAVLFAVCEALTEVINDMGLGDAFKAWLDSWNEEEGGRENEG